MVVQRVNRFLECINDKDYPLVIWLESQLTGRLEKFYDGTTLGCKMDEDLFLIDIRLISEGLISLICAW